ncbi:MFS transporter [Streptomyces globisporus]|uniref:MFS transporter n=1 Tax=Streptomyces globisporus TaxID=1908 RepID=UPI0036310E0D
MTATGTARVTAMRRRCAFVLLGGIQATLIFRLAAIAVPLPRVARELGIERTDVILLSTAYGLTFAGLLLFGGRLAGRYGGRRALIAGLALFAVASAAAPLAPVSRHCSRRASPRARAALVAPAAMAVLHAILPSPAAYSRAMATWGGVSVLGATAGNLLSGVISALLSWHWTFAVPVVVTIAVLVLAPRLLPGTVPDRGRSLDLPGALLAVLGITLASYGLVVTDARPGPSAGVLVALLGGTALLAAFWYAERRARDPLPPGFLSDRRRVLAPTAIALSSCGTAMTFVVLSLHLQRERDWSPLQTSAAFVPFALALLASGRVTGPLISRYGARTITGAELSTGATGHALLAFTKFATHASYAYGLLPGPVLLPAGAAASFAGAAVLATEGVPLQQTGLAGGVLNTATECGPTVLFAVLLTLDSDAWSLAATGVALAVGALPNHRTK